MDGHGKTEKDDGLLVRKDETKSARGGIEFRRRAAVVAALCGSAEFRAWLYGTLDDLCAFSRDVGMLTDYGQGIRAAAHRIEERLLVASESVQMLADMHHRSLKAEHERIVAANKEE